MVENSSKKKRTITYLYRTLMLFYGLYLSADDVGYSDIKSGAVVACLRVGTTITFAWLCFSVSLRLASLLTAKFRFHFPAEVTASGHWRTGASPWAVWVCTHTVGIFLTLCACLSVMSRAVHRPFGGVCAQKEKGHTPKKTKNTDLLSNLTRRGESGTIWWVTHFAKLFWTVKKTALINNDQHNFSQNRL